MKRYVAMALMLVAMCGYSQVPIHSNSRTVDVERIYGDFDSFKFNWTGESDQRCQYWFYAGSVSNWITLETGKVAARVNKGSTIYVDVPTASITVSGSNITFDVSRTNVPPSGEYQMEVYAWQGVTTNPARTIAQGSVIVTKSLYSSTNTFPFPAMASLTDYVLKTDWQASNAVLQAQITGGYVTTIEFQNTNAADRAIQSSLSARAGTNETNIGILTTGKTDLITFNASASALATTSAALTTAIGNLVTTQAQHAVRLSAAESTNATATATNAAQTAEIAGMQAYLYEVGETSSVAYASAIDAQNTNILQTAEIAGIHDTNAALLAEINGLTWNTMLARGRDLGAQGGDYAFSLTPNDDIRWIWNTTNGAGIYVDQDDGRLKRWSLATTEAYKLLEDSDLVPISSWIGNLTNAALVALPGVTVSSQTVGSVTTWTVGNAYTSQWYNVLSMIAPTNGQWLFQAHPFAAGTTESAETIVSLVGSTGVVSIVTGTGPLDGTTIITNIMVNGTVTNTDLRTLQRLVGCNVSGLSNFTATNQLSVNQRAINK